MADDVKKSSKPEKVDVSKKGAGKAKKPMQAKAEKKSEAAVKKAVPKLADMESVVAKEKHKDKVANVSKSSKTYDNINKNKTTFLKPAEVRRRWLVLDASGKPLGRVAALAASMLRGKHRVDFTPNVDCGDSIIIINCRDVVLTGRKLEQKVRYRHSGWMGGLKELKYSVIMKKCPQKAMMWAVQGMLPHNSLGARMARRLRTYAGEDHGHEAQKPQLYKF